MLEPAKGLGKNVMNVGLARLPPNQRKGLKEWFELRYWRKKHRDFAGDPAKTAHERSHYEYFFTEFFDLTKKDYANKRVLDIGCGPLGSLEWADMTKERVGLDALSSDYQKLGTLAHKMKYVQGISESMPFPDAYFDIATTFNSLDHVDDLSASIRELKRVVARGARILIIAEIGHTPTFTEPHRIDASVLDAFEPEFKAIDKRLYGIRPDHQLYASLYEGLPAVAGRPALLCARLESTPA